MCARLGNTGNMNKDAVLATLIGFAIGLTITGIIIVAPTLARSAPKLPKITLPSISLGNQKKEASIPTPKVSALQEGTKTFAILTPIADSIVPKNPVAFEGTADSSATSILVQTDTEDTICAITKSSWSCQIALSEGNNSIAVHQIQNDTIIKSKTITLYYTPESL